MRKILIAFAALAFSISVANAEITDNTCVDVNQAITAATPVATILDDLMEPGCGMSLQEAVDAVIAAGGDQDNTLVAAHIIDPLYEYTPPTDPTQQLPATAAGVAPGSSGGPKTSISTTTGGGGGASPA